MVTTTANTAASLRRGVAAGLTMIISMNATVCGDMNHGGQRAVHDRWQRAGEEGSQEVGKETVSRGYKDFEFGAESDASCPGLPSGRRLRRWCLRLRGRDSAPVRLHLWRDAGELSISPPPVRTGAARGRPVPAGADER